MSDYFLFLQIGFALLFVVVATVLWFTGLKRIATAKAEKNEMEALYHETIQQNEAYIRQLEKRVEAHSAELQLAINRQHVEIVERRKVEQEINEQRRLLKTIIDQAPMHIYLKGLDGKYILANSDFTSSMGQGDLIGKTCFDLYDKDIADILSKHDEMTLEQGHALDWEEVLQAGDNPQYVHSYRFVTHGEDGSVTGLGGIIIDITEKRRDSFEIQKLSKVVEQSPVSVVITDPEGIVEYVNPRYTDMTGYEAEEVIGQKPYFLTSGVKEGTEQQDMWDQLKSGKVWAGESLNCKSSGELLWEKSTIAPIFGAMGEISNYVALQEDVTEHKINISALQDAKAEAEAANLAKSQFLANMSHEIRTPMNGVIGMSNLLLDSILNEAQREYVTTIHTCGNELLNVINQILDFSKAESGKVEVEFHHFDLRSCVEDSLDLIATRAAEKHLRLFYCFDADVPEIVQTDSTRLRQIVVNLVGNAVKFTQEGYVYCRVHLKEQTGQQAVVCLSVQDTGIGIPEEKLNRLFAEFSQVDSSITREFGGTGLGLAISQKLAILLGGDITVVSEEGKGACFTLQFPVECSAIQEKERKAHEKKELPGKNCLILDPIQDGGNALETLCAGWGMQATVLQDEEAAFQRIQKDAKVDLLILDFFLLKQNGFQFVSRVRKLAEKKDLSIVLMTPRGRVQPEEIQKDSFTQVVTRPMKKANLLKGIRKSLQGVLQQGPVVEKRMIQTSLEEAFPFHILVGENNPINQQLLVRLLQKLGYRADIAGSGPEVLEGLARKDYDLILLDFNLPEMDGLTTARKIQKLYEAKPEHKPLLFGMVTSQNNQTINQSQEAGIADILLKPVMIGTLQEKLILWGQKRFHSVEKEENHEA